MIRIAHIINPVKIEDPQSDLVTAQPITFETMRRAKEFAQGKVEVELLCTQYEEDHSVLPQGFTVLPDLSRSVQDVGTFEKVRKYPLIQDILQLAFENSDADYLIYTNVDIAVQENFYTTVADLIDKGHDALIINRRRIPAHYTKLEQIEEMWQEAGLPHPGFDCFVFRKEKFPSFELDQVCVGVPFIGILMAQNIFALSSNYLLLTDAHLTQHIGLEIFKKRAPDEYFGHNQKAFWRAISRLWGSMDLRKLPFWNWFPIIRIIRWGFHPSIPIRLVLRLERKSLVRTLLGKEAGNKVGPPKGP